MVPQPHEIRAHVLDQSHLLSDQIFRHGSADASMIFFPLRASHKKALAIQLERAMVDKFEPSTAKAFYYARLPMSAGDLNFAAIERRMGRRPQLGAIQVECRNLLLPLPGGHTLARRPDDNSFRIEKLN